MPIESTIAERVIYGTVAAVFAVFSFLFRRVNKRIESLEEHSVSRREYDGTIARLEKAIEKDVGDIKAAIRDLGQHLHAADDRSEARVQRAMAKLDEHAEKTTASVRGVYDRVERVESGLRAEIAHVRNGKTPG